MSTFTINIIGQSCLWGPTRVSHLKPMLSHLLSNITSVYKTVPLFFLFLHDFSHSEMRERWWFKAINREKMLTLVCIIWDFLQYELRKLVHPCSSAHIASPPANYYYAPCVPTSLCKGWREYDFSPFCGDCLNPLGLGCMKFGSKSIP